MAQFVGRVIGTKMHKTAKVSVNRMFLNPFVLKFVKKKKTYFAHDEDSECREGDLVMIKECQKYNNKSFNVIEILERSQSYTNPKTGITVYQKLK